MYTWVTFPADKCPDFHTGKVVDCDAHVTVPGQLIGNQGSARKRIRFASENGKSFGERTFPRRDGFPDSNGVRPYLYKVSIRVKRTWYLPVSRNDVSTVRCQPDLNAFFCRAEVSESLCPECIAVRVCPYKVSVRSRSTVRNAPS